MVIISQPAPLSSMNSAIARGHVILVAGEGLIVVDFRVSVAGADPVGGLEELAEWLGLEPGLRGLIRPAVSVPSPGQLGGVTDVLVAALGTGGAVSVFASSLRAFLSQPRRSDVRIVVQDPDGRRVEVVAQRVEDVEGLLRRALEPGE